MIRKQYRTVDEPIRFSAGHTSVVPGQWSVSKKKHSQEQEAVAKFTSDFIMWL